MNLLRLRIRPAGAWVTPWQADTLMGMLACALARAAGDTRLEDELLDPWRAGHPPFVLSDAFPGDLLPAPACLPLLGWPEEQRKLVKRTEWLTPEQFRQLQAGNMPAITAELPEAYSDGSRVRNTLDRVTDRTGAPGSLFDTPAILLAREQPWLSVYGKVAPGKETLLLELFHLLSETGFGADASVGFGQFSVDASHDGAAWLVDVTGADGWVSLSTCQPGPRDPTDGCWRSFIKQGKLGPDFGVDSVFKRPQWMLRPGARFRQPPPLPDWAGRVIASEELLPAALLNQLHSRGVRPVQPAFALAVPMKWRQEFSE